MPLHNRTVGAALMFTAAPLTVIGFNAAITLMQEPVVKELSGIAVATALIVLGMVILKEEVPPLMQFVFTTHIAPRVCPQPQPQREE